MSVVRTVVLSLIFDITSHTNLTSSVIQVGMGETHRNTHIIIRNPQPCTNTHIPACSSFFHPVCSNPLLSTAVRDANKHTNKVMSGRDV